MRVCGTDRLLSYARGYGRTSVIARRRKSSPGFLPSASRTTRRAGFTRQDGDGKGARGCCVWVGGWQVTSEVKAGVQDGGKNSSGVRE